MRAMRCASSNAHPFTGRDPRRVSGKGWLWWHDNNDDWYRYDTNQPMCYRNECYLCVCVCAWVSVCRSKHTRPRVWLNNGFQEATSTRTTTTRTTCACACCDAIAIRSPTFRCCLHMVFFCLSHYLAPVILIRKCIRSYARIRHGVRFRGLLSTLVDWFPNWRIGCHRFHGFYCVLGSTTYAKRVRFCGRLEPTFIAVYY